MSLVELYHRKDKKRMSETKCPFSGKGCQLNLCELYCHDDFYTYGISKCAITSLGYDIAGIRAELHKLNDTNIALQQIAIALNEMNK